MTPSVWTHCPRRNDATTSPCEFSDVKSEVARLIRKTSNHQQLQKGSRQAIKQMYENGHQPACSARSSLPAFIMFCHVSRLAVVNRNARCFHYRQLPVHGALACGEHSPLGSQLCRRQVRAANMRRDEVCNLRAIRCGFYVF